jgi:oligopeptide/dipeptide ABC transporter ATP-binding protein
MTICNQGFTADNRLAIGSGRTSAASRARTAAYPRLLAAVLSLSEPKSRRRSGLGCPVPSLLDRPAGCPFHPRCPRKVGSACEQPAPWQEPAPNHRYRCVIAPAALRELQTG